MDEDIIRVEVSEASNRQAHSWTIKSLSLTGVSREPLFDACRALKAAGVDRHQRVGIFRERSTPDISCAVEWGAAHTIGEGANTGIRLRLFRTDRLKAMKAGAARRSPEEP